MRLRSRDIVEFKSIPPWINVTAFQNGWRNVGSGFAPASYFRDGTGLVHVRGRLTGGLVTYIMFTLPEGYRPDLSLMLPAAGYSSGAVVAGITIDAAGNVAELGSAPDLGFYVVFLASTGTKQGALFALRDKLEDRMEDEGTDSLPEEKEE